MDSGSPMPRGAVVSLCAILAGAFVLRCLFMGDVFLEEVVLPWGLDSYYHLWRIDHAVHNGLSLPRWDPFLNAPEGAYNLYPDGFAGLVALVVWLSHGGDATVFEVRATSMFVLPVLGVLGCLATFWVARRALGAWPGVGAAALAAVLPVHIQTAMLGRVDHHVLELVLPSVAVVALVAPGRRRGCLLGGAALAGLSYGCTGGILHALLAGAAVFAAGFRHVLSGEPDGAREQLRRGALAFALAALLCFPDAVSRRGGLAYYEPSWLSTLMFSAAAAGLFVLSLLTSSLRRLVLAAAGLLAGGGASIVLLLPGASEFVGAAGATDLLTESQPLWRTPMDALRFHSGLVLAFPLALTWLAWSRPSPLVWALAALGLCGLCLAVLQVRFGMIMAIPAAVFLAGAGVELWRHGRALSRTALVVVTAAALWPSALFLSRASLVSTGSLAVLEASQWLASFTPDPGPRTPGNRADWSVLTHWGDGTAIAYLANRPTVIGAFYHGDFERGFLDGMKMLYGEEDPEPLMEARKVRWIVLPALLFGSEADLGALVGARRGRDVPCLYARLFDSEGGAVSDGQKTLPGLGRYRLVHDSPHTSHRRGKDVPAAKIFERVAGAVLEGRCEGEPVLVRHAVSTDTGRSFEYVDVASCRDGRWTLRVPYAGEWAVRAGPRGLAADASVAERDVREGRAVRLP